MKSLYESLLTGKVSKPSAKVVPSSKEELQQLISEHIEEIKPRPGQEVDLNWIDISEVDDLGGLFNGTNYIPVINTWKIDHVVSFRSMFENNEYIKSSPLPRLQKKLLDYGCYKLMFTGCTTLKVAPELPAIKLTPYCYWGMFWGCSSLVDPPMLPAVQLAHDCYYGMFKGCGSLKVAPELPATELVSNCYVYMFAGCTALKERAKTSKNVPVDQPNYARGMYAGCPCNR